MERRHNSEAGIAGLETQNSDEATIGDDDNMEIDDMNDMVAATGVEGLVHSLLIGTLGLDEMKENNESLEQQIGSVHEVMEKRQEGEIRHLLITYDILEAISNKRFDELRKSRGEMEGRLRELLQSRTIQITDFEEYNVLMDKCMTALCNAIYELKVLVSQIEQEDVDNEDLFIQLEEKGKDVMSFFEVLYDNMETPTDDIIDKDIHNNMFDVKAWLGEIIEAIHNGTVGSIEDMVEEVEVQVKKRKKGMGNVEIRKLWTFKEENPPDESWDDDQLWKWYNKCNEAMGFAPLSMSDADSSDYGNYPISEKGIKDHHHHTEEYNLGVFGGNDEEFTSIADKSKESIETLVTNDVIQTFETAKDDGISAFIQRCKNLDQICNKIVTEFCKVGSCLCIDHRLFTKVMQRPELMKILGIIDPRICKGGLMVIKKSWKAALPSLVEDISKTEREGRLAEALIQYDPKQYWESVDLNLADIVLQMAESSKKTYGDIGSSRRF